MFCDYASGFNLWYCAYFGNIAFKLIRIHASLAETYQNILCLSAEAHQFNLHNPLLANNPTYIHFRLGPMMTSWCMRFEAKHQYFKKLAAGLGNFKNLALTLATRHQNKQCYTKFNICKQQNMDQVSLFRKIQY